MTEGLFKSSFHRVVLVAFVAMCQVAVSLRLKVQLLSIPRKASHSRLYYLVADEHFTKEDENVDPYADLFNLSAPIEAEVAPITAAQSSIIPADSNAKPVRARFHARLKARPEFWNKDLEEVYQSAEAMEEDPDRQEFFEEVKDVIETNKGHAIWSKRSSGEIKRQMRKMAGYRKQRLPMFVTRVITAVYLDKEHTLDTFEYGDATTFSLYKKWVAEKRKVMEKDPVVVAEKVCSIEWLDTHPTDPKFWDSNSFRYLPRSFLPKTPLVVVDEVSPYEDIFENPVRMNYVINQRLNANNGSGNSNNNGGSSSYNGAFKTTANTASALLMPTVVNWHKEAVELLNSVTNPSSKYPANYSSGPSNANRSDGKRIPTLPASNQDNETQTMFRIDDTAMFVANHHNEDFFVVL